MVIVTKEKGFCKAGIFGVFVKHWSRGCMASCFLRIDGVRTLVSYPDVDNQRLLDMFCGSCPEHSVLEGKS
jgi:hypothetical protein